jgi:hypothetical protein
MLVDIFYSGYFIGVTKGKSKNMDNKTDYIINSQNIKRDDFITNKQRHAAEAYIKGIYIKKELIAFLDSEEKVKEIAKQIGKSFRNKDSLHRIIKDKVDKMTLSIQTIKAYNFIYNDMDYARALKEIL